MSGESNGKKDLLHSLLSDPDRLIKLVTIALILISGGGNLFATKGVERTNTEEWDRAIKEIHEMHTALAGALERQKKILDANNKTLDSADHAMKELDEITDYIREQKKKNP
jgi:molybdopterin converting factor small subunit